MEGLGFEFFCQRKYNHSSEYESTSIFFISVSFLVPGYCDHNLPFQWYFTFQMASRELVNILQVGNEISVQIKNPRRWASRI